MEALCREEDRRVDFDDFDTLAQAIDDGELAGDASTHALCDDGVPYRRHRVVEYAGSPGAIVCCPLCGLSGKRVDGWGAYFCERCGYSNTEERAVPGDDESGDGDDLD